MLILLGTSAQACLRFLVRRVRGPITIAERAQWLHESCRLALHRLGIEIVRDGRFPSRGLLVSNHLSYLDILVFSAILAGRFRLQEGSRCMAALRLAGTFSGYCFPKAQLLTAPPYFLFVQRC